MKYKYTRKEIVSFINDNHGWHIHDEAIARKINELVERVNKLSKNK